MPQEPFQIDPEFEALIPPMRADELEGLTASLDLEGCRDPLVVWEGELILLDGHNRHRHCIAQGIPFKIRTVNLLDRNAAKLWIIRNQLGRRNLSDLDRIALAGEGEKIIAAKAKANQVVRKGEQPGSTPQKSADLPIDTRSEAAALAGVSHDTYAKGKRILEQGATELVTAVRENRASINAASEIAALPAKEQREIVAKGEKEILDAAKRLKTEKLERQRADREQRKLEELEQRARLAPGSKRTEWHIETGDCVELLCGRNGLDKPRLVFADPPYNIGIDYGDHFDDSRSSDEFERWSMEWMTGIHANLADDGSFWLLVNHEWAYVLAFAAVDAIGFHLRQWITWYESFGVNTTSKFNRCSRPLLWFTKDRDEFVFNDHAPEIRRESDRQTRYNDARANPDGKLWDDVWGINPPIPRLTGTSSERIPTFPTQLPLSLLRPIIACATKPGDLVLDPFCGSGTTGEASLELGRRFEGYELSRSFADLSRRRLLGVSSVEVVA
jgi:DNA modification methylase